MIPAEHNRFGTPAERTVLFDRVCLAAADFRVRLGRATVTRLRGMAAADLRDLDGRLSDAKTPGDAATAVWAAVDRQPTQRR